MKTQKALLLVACLLQLIASMPVAAAGLSGQLKWEKYVMPNGKLSFHHPAGWKVQAQESNIEVVNGATGEQLALWGVPYESGKSPRELAETMLAMLKQKHPDLAASDWKTDTETQDSVVVFRISYTEEKTKCLGCVCVQKDKARERAHWFASSAPADKYYQPRAVALLQAFLTSISPDKNSKAPDGAIPESEPSTVSDLTGDWSSIRNFGDVVALGSGSYVRPSGSAELYNLHPDGTFRHVIYGSGSIISGVSTTRGTYIVEGRSLILHTTFETWQPDPSNAARNPPYKDKPQDKVEKFSWWLEGDKIHLKNSFGVVDIFYKITKIPATAPATPIP